LAAPCTVAILLKPIEVQLHICKTEHKDRHDRATRWIKEAIHICKKGQQAINCEEGSYQLSHACDCFLGTSATNRAKNQKKK